MTSMILAVSLVILSADDKGAEQESLRKSLTFHAAFDGAVDAGFAAGDKRLYTASTFARADAKPGNLRGDVQIVKGEGRYGDALRFGKPAKEVLFYQADKNMGYREQDWSGTISLWLRLTPEQDLQPGYADPIQITDKKWDDASLFVDFSKDETPRHFRLGVFADFKSWNPTARAWEAVPVKERPMVVVERPPFRRDRWTHVVCTYAHLNTDRKDAEARMYLDGQPQGRLTGPQRLTWQPAKAAIMLGLSYIGDFDDLAIFNRALSEAEVQTLHGLKAGVADLHP